jgi:hypothetical protein
MAKIGAFMHSTFKFFVADDAAQMFTLRISSSTRFFLDRAAKFFALMFFT